MRKLLLVWCALIVSSGLFASIFPIQRFMPENRLARFDRADVSNISQDDFNTVITKVEAYYKPLVQRLYGANLTVIRDWANPTVNAYSSRPSSNVWQVNMFGGLARRQEITPDGFLAVVCHEVGHQVAGFPYVSQGQWPANEGQSDYFATLACARRLWAADVDQNALSAKLIPAYPKQLCDASWANQDDRNLCYRLALAGKSLADLLSGGMAKFETPDRSQVPRTNPDHPQGQCRLDTYLAGAICTVEFDDEMVPRNEAQSAQVTCQARRGEAGFRPRCWFKPRGQGFED